VCDDVDWPGGLLRDLVRQLLFGAVVDASIVEVHHEERPGHAPGDGADGAGLSRVAQAVIDAPVPCAVAARAGDEEDDAIAGRAARAGAVAARVQQQHEREDYEPLCDARHC
jgi:hypothetical protein